MISIITTTLNSNRTIKDTLKSVQEQNYPVEHIIIDGASSDNTLEIVNSFPHVKTIITEPDTGIYDAMNKGINLATGEVIGILNSDDIFANQSILSKVMKEFEDGSIDALYGNISYFRDQEYDKTIRYWRSKPYYENFFDNGEVPPHPSLFVRRKVYEQIGTYYPNFKIASDHEFMFRMLKVHGYKSKFIDETIVKMRVGGISTSGIKSYIQSTKELKQVWEMNGFSYPWKLFILRPLKKLKQLLKLK